MNALLVVCGLGFISLLGEIVNLKKGLHLAIILGLVIAAGAAVADWNTSAYYFNNMLTFDRFSTALTCVIIVLSTCWLMIASPYLVGQSHQSDRTALVLFTMVGSIMMVSFHNMTILFLGIEILSISLYALAGSNKESFFSNEAAFKYFIMGSFATGFLLMGIALVYGATGSFDVTQIANFLVSHQASLPGFFYVGLFLMLVGIGFKISAVPFHFWAPDVYAGSPTMITAFMSTVVKVAAVGAFYKIFGECFLPVQSSTMGTLQVMIVLTLVIANLIAAYQKNMKRMLAYSSIAHVGYILLGFYSEPLEYKGMLFYYLISYSVVSLMAFGILYIIENNRGITSIEALAGLFKVNPFAATCLTVALLSLAGIPPLAGFFSKYMILGHAVEAGQIPLVLLAVITSLIGVYYYFKPVIAMFGQPERTDELTMATSQKLILALLAAVSVLLGVLPEWFITCID